MLSLSARSWLPESATPEISVKATSAIDGKTVQSSLFMLVSSCPDLDLRPEPAESSRGQQAKNEAVENMLDNRAPRLARPDAIADLPHAVSHERNRAGHPKDREILRSGRNGASC